MRGGGRREHLVPGDCFTQSGPHCLHCCFLRTGSWQLTPFPLEHLITKVGTIKDVCPASWLHLTSSTLSPRSLSSPVQHRSCPGLAARGGRGAGRAGRQQVDVCFWGGVCLVCQEHPRGQAGAETSHVSVAKSRLASAALRRMLFQKRVREVLCPQVCRWDAGRTLCEQE